MSVTSRKSKGSHVSSILKPPSLTARLNDSRNAVKVRFQLPYLTSVQKVLQNYLKNREGREYEQLVVLIRDSELFDSDVDSIIEEAGECIPALNKDLRLFVEVLLSIKWPHREHSTVKNYQAFLINLVTAHNYYLKYAVDKLLGYFIPGTQELEWTNGLPREEDSIVYANVHQVLSFLLRLIPMSGEIIFNALVSHFPYINKSSHVHEVYVYNLLLILKYQPRFRADVLRLIFSKLVLLDVHAPKEEISRVECSEDVFEMDDETNPVVKMKLTTAHNLDICLDRIYNFFITECHNLETQEFDWDTTKGLYQDMLSIFDQIILPTYNTHHVQFVMYLLCSFNRTIAEAFLQYLWKKVTTPREASVLRQSAVVYMASLLARASFIPLPTLKSTLKEMALWIHAYIASQDVNEFVNLDLRVHGVFYCLCQSLFYVVAFRQKDLVNTKRNISFLESLNLAKMVTSKLNPLRVCQPAVVQNFAAVTRTYQLAYCYSIMEHNSRNMLPIIYQDEKGSYVTTSTTMPALFPFDPYVLKRSGDKIWPFYLNYQEADSSGGAGAQKEDKSFEDDDFLCDNGNEMLVSSKMDMFSYGTSPGFKHLT